MTIKQSLKTGVWLVSAAGMISAAVDPAYEIGTWENFCQGAVSHTFDDNTANQTKVAQPIFDAKKFKMTLFTATNSMNPNWDKLKTAFAAGHEIASHSVTHPQTMSDDECLTSQSTIIQKVPGEKCVTIAYPNCNIPTPTQTNLKKCYIAGRICDNKIMPKTPSDFYRLSAFMAGSAGTNSADGLNSKANEAAASNGWLIWCHHGVGDDKHGYSNTATDALQANINFLDQNRAKIWTGSFSDVARYIKERNAASVAVKSSDDKSITITVTDNLADSIFNYPLSIRRALPDGWTTAAVTQKGVAVDDSIITVNSKKYVMFKAVPDGGDVVISSGAVGVIRHSSRTASGISPVTLQNGTIAIDAQYFSNSALTVELFDLKGKVIARQNLTAGQSSIALAGKNIGSSAFIANISGGNTKWTGKFIPQL